ncbi:hypothetical protein [Streptomyces phytohabitans]|uniref:CysS/YqeB C-terminal domain-containing protein n=1 Tax=Streptomyces phytohabitans TaxID=1150371 RepID=UPI00345BF9C2
MDAERGLLALMGSGETSPTMVTLHRELVAHLEPEPGAVVLETPYAFQVNRDDISSRARDYFRRSVGLVTSVAPEAADATWGDSDGVRDRVRRAAWVFSGPGSPSYALERWAARGMDEVLVERVRRGYGVTVMASAAACTTGFAALPVYEVYKAGHAPAWLDGLDMFGALGLPVAVIPHYDNAEGGTHDTRFCYLGEPRLSALEKELPAESAVLGIDEHTALIIDLDSSAARVWGRGVLTVRRRGVSTLIPAGTSFTLDVLRGLVSGEEGAHTARPQPGSADPSLVEQPAGDAPATLEEVVNDLEGRFDAAREKRDARRMTEFVLALEAAIAEWGADMEEDQGGGEWARTVLRGLVRQLTAPAQQGMLEPERSLGRVLAPLLEYRRRLRAQGAYGQADELRDVLARGGVEVRDTGGAGLWLLSDAPPRPSRE